MAAGSWGSHLEPGRIRRSSGISRKQSTRYAKQLVAALDKIEALSGKPGRWRSGSRLRQKARRNWRTGLRKSPGSTLRSGLTVRLIQSIAGDADLISAQGGTFADRLP